MAVIRVTRVTATSSESFQDAILKGLDRANKTLRGITKLEVISQRAIIKDGKISEYSVTIDISFVLEPLR